MMVRSFGYLCISLVLASCLVGCAVFLPYVYPDSTMRDDTSLAAAIKYASAAKQEYLQAQNAYAGTSTIIPFVTIPLAAAGLGLGITGTTGNPITALGLAAGTGVAVGVWAQNKPREMAYNLGFQAINCLLQSVEPFQAAASQEFHDAIFGNEGKPSLASELAELKGHLGRFEKAIIDDTKLNGLQKQALNAYAGQAENYAKEIEKLVMSGEQLAGIASGVPRNLVNNVDTVIGKINNAIRETTPNVQAVAATIAGLSVLQPASMARPTVPPPPDPKYTNDPQRANTFLDPNLYSDVVAEREAVQDAVVKTIAPLATTVRTAIIKSQYTKETPTISNCLQIPDSFSVVVRPAETSIITKQGMTRRVPVSGGKGPYFATVSVGPPNAGDLTASAKMDGGYYAEIVVSKTCPTNTADRPYKIHIGDVIGTGADISVVVEATTQLTATPADISIDPNNDKKVSVVVSGGKPPYSPVVLGATNVTIAPVAGKSDTFDVTVKNTATEGSVVFGDSSKPQLQIAVPVTAKSP